MLLSSFALGSTLVGQDRVGTVRGTVVDTAGSPLEGVDISVGSRTTRTNARGFFLLDSLSLGRYTLVARFPGHTPVRAPINVVTGRPVELFVRLFPAAYFLPEVLVESRRTGIFGAVLGPSLVPVPGARVQIIGAGSKDTRTDSTGTFAFPGVRSGQYLVRVTAMGYGEQRSLVELHGDEGRQVRFRLMSSRSSPHRADDAALADLGLRLTAGSKSDRLTSAQLERYETLGLCELAQIRERVGQSRMPTTLILNGTTVMKEFTVASLCSWQANEVDLVEFGGDYCRDLTGTIAPLIDPRVRCLRTGRYVPGRSYVILWEKR